MNDKVVELEYVNYPNLNEAVMSLGIKHVKILRAWYLFRFLDKAQNGAKGCFSQKAALRILQTYLKISQSYSYQLLKSGDGLFWSLSTKNNQQSYVFYYGLVKLSEIFDINRYAEENYLPFGVLLSDIKQVRADFYSSAIGRNSSITPIARQTINAYYGISKNTQRSYEKQTYLNLQKTESFIDLYQTKKYDAALTMANKFKAEESINEHSIKIKRVKDGFVVGLQKGNLYSSDSHDAEMSSALRKHNYTIKRRRKLSLFEDNIESSVTASGNNERKTGAPVRRELDKDLKLYYPSNKKRAHTTGFTVQEIESKNRYVFKGFIKASQLDAYYGGSTPMKDICLYEINYYSPHSPFNFLKFHTFGTQ